MNRAAGGGDGEVADVRRPWLPECLALHDFTTEMVQELSYLVVEEMVEDVTAITVSPWPAADGYGRLRFVTDVDRVAEVAVPTAVLFEQLYRGQLGRRPRIGDVFGAHVDPDVLAEARAETDGVWEGPLARLLPEGVYDLSAEARKVAKLAFYSVRSDILPEAEVTENRMEATVARTRRQARHLAVREPAGEGDGS